MKVSILFKAQRLPGAAFQSQRTSCRAKCENAQEESTWSDRELSTRGAWQPSIYYLVSIYFKVAVQTKVKYIYIYIWNLKKKVAGGAMLTGSSL